MAVSASFLGALRDVLAFVPDLRIKKMFGGAGVYDGDLIFALAVNEALYLKADEQTERQFDDLGLAAFEVRGRATRYRRAPEEVWEDPDVAREWVALALAAARRAAASN